MRDNPEREPPLHIDPDELEFRRRVRDRILRRYGATCCNDAPDDALRAYYRFIQCRALVRP
uniref:Uncharacterized protein n=1 Tax=viral metagenome TaxID=1070528 RepID=A0A6M3LBY6_9ZZZZ